MGELLTVFRVDIQQKNNIRKYNNLKYISNSNVSLWPSVISSAALLHGADRITHPQTIKSAISYQYNICSFHDQLSSFKFSYFEFTAPSVCVDPSSRAL